MHYGKNMPHFWQLVQYIVGAKCPGFGSQYGPQAKILNAIDLNREILKEQEATCIMATEN